MKILHVCSTSAISGANRYAFDLAAGQAALGHDVTVITPALPGHSLDLKPPEVKQVSFDGIYPIGLISTLRRLRGDVIHCHGGKAAKWLRLMPARPASVISLHIRFKKNAMEHFDGVHALADWQMEGLQSFKGLVKKVNNWAPKLNASAPGAAEACRQSVGAYPDTPLAVFVGRLDPVKGVDTLIRAFRKIDRSDIRLAIVGDGSETEALKALAGPDCRISFAGYSKAPADWYNAADLVVMPSRHEPFALVALEAMSCNTPLLASDLEGFQEIFRDRPDNRFPEGNAAALAAAISNRLAGKIPGVIMRDQYDMHRFNRDAGVAAVTEFYADVCAAKQGLFEPLPT
ncbi:glycosyltransferase family 4 protein [Hyphomonas sp. WL0036]|uniref:glycosyltransferase family 4 protein n=1 Tax=Hyphomonas sediminis TaxID=2866160 RepID=UPI001C81C655|nr:glycosyltransferase family 4 protein [Hyphomonas sediminis]MBY9067985.1 glycosyltransferase family 4 protein [Hyphomonas sediminis]